MNEGDLKAFLLQSNLQGYAEGDAKAWTRQPDHSTTISFEQGPWRLDDNFFGGEPYGGREVVFHEGRPVWMLVYFGWVAEEHDASPLYEVLRHALARMPADHPYRGPTEFVDGPFKYVNEWTGDIGRVAGREQIILDDSVAYAADYSGGWVDRRAGV